MKKRKGKNHAESFLCSTCVHLVPIANTLITILSGFVTKVCNVIGSSWRRDSLLFAGSHMVIIFSTFQLM